MTSTSEVTRRFISSDNLKVLNQLQESLKGSLATSVFWEYAMMCFSTPRPSTDFDGTAKFSRLDPIRNCIQTIAAANNWIYHTDSAGNIYLRSSNTSNEPAVVLLQGHLDIVCSQNASAKHDFEKDPINVRISEDGQWIRSIKETTLGADNGVGVAGALAALTVMPREPPIEVILTANEETNFEGAEGADSNFVTASRMLNLDSEVDGEICIGSAGGFEHKFWLPIYRTESPDGWRRYRLSLKGFLGGHSGIDIDEKRLNSIIVLQKLLRKFTSQSVLVEHVEGGTGPNAIPREAAAVIAVDPNNWGPVKEELMKYFQAILKEHPSEESAVLLIDEELESNTSSKGPLSFEFIKRLMTIIDKVPHGVIEREEGSDEPRTSCNLGVLRIVSKDGSEFAMVHVFPRSTSMEALRVVGQQFSELGDKVGAKSETDICPFPGWEPDRESELLKVVRSTCPTVADPRIYTIHAGLECGTLMSRLTSVKECASIGPTVKGAHSPHERLEIATCAPFMKWVCDSIALLQE